MNDVDWRKFPIVLTSHSQGNWEFFLEESEVLRSAIGPVNIFRISHIGSTAVLGLIAKPIVDILIEFQSCAVFENVKKLMINLNYTFPDFEENKWPDVFSYKGYGSGKCFHVHLRPPGDCNELYFRDYLIAHNDIADKYGALKVELANKFRNDRASYCLAKTEFIEEVTKLAKAEFYGRYSVLDKNNIFVE